MINENFNKEAEPQIFKIGEKIYYAWYIGEEDDKIFYKTVDGEKICFPSERIEEAFVFEPKKAEKTVEERPPKKAEEKPKAPAKKKK